ncbi:MAG TPA: hypothetical protein VHL31_19615 [Geminicoccus sp.]|jgi:hypothetical protein|uniref:hypothetical protein n=1 Tax=Geminicoccus sp. TaxID=2024832 RepID=UPI002E2F427B|nr:hypothetical protein [Geminicoccus sp.]HEX2528495.1 hypothetical protein [Geminicoccus sp.]
MTNLSERIKTGITLFDLAKAMATRRGNPFDPPSGGSGVKATLPGFIVDYWRIDELHVVEVRPRWSQMHTLGSAGGFDRLFSARRKHDEFLITTFQRGVWERRFLGQVKPLQKL